MTSLMTMMIFVFGAMIGSFLNVCIYRLPKGRSVVLPPSQCPHCNKHILWYDNIPVISYLMLRGKCRFCKGKISIRYIVVEILTATLLTLLYVAFGQTAAKFFAYSILFCGLIVATFVDFEIQEIPDQVSIGLLAVGFVYSFAFPQIFGLVSRWNALFNSFVGALAGGASIYLIGLLGRLIFKKRLKALGLKEAMGGGDVVLMAMIGAFVGWKLALVTFFIAPVFGAIVGMIMKLKYGQDIIAYGPYLSFAAIISVFWGERILDLFVYRMY